MLSSSRSQLSLAGLLCMLVGTLVYSNTLHCGIVYDDEPAIMKNRDLRPQANWIDLFYHDFWGTVITNPTSHKSYRPLCVATFRLNYLMAELEPMGYHLVNILLHGVVCYLYVHLVSLVCSQVWPALIAGLLFAVHPIHTEAVAGLVGRTELLSAIFFSLSFMAYHRAYTRGMRWVGVSVCLMVCSVLSKEQGVTVVAVCTVHDLFIQHRNTPSSTVHLLHSIFSNRKSLPSWFPAFVKRMCIIATVTMALLVLRITLVGGAPKIFHENINPPLSLSWPWRQLSWSHLVAVNSWLALCPSPLTADWRFGAVPLTLSLAHPHNLHTLLTLLTLTGLTTFALYRRWGTVLFGLSLLVFPYVPASNLFFPVGFVVAERVLYLPSMGLCLLAAHGLWKLHNHFNSIILRSTLKLSFILLLVTFATKTYTRNKDWESNVTLYSAGVKVNSRHGVFLTNLGIEHGRLRNFSFAEKLYRRTMLEAPLHSRGFSNFGGLMEALKRYDEAEQAFRTAIRLGKQDSTGTKVIETLEFLLDKIILRNNDRYGDAVELVDQALSNYPSYGKLYNLKGIYLQRQGRSKAAIELLQTAININFITAQGLYHLGLAYTDTGDKRRAVEAFKAALSMDPTYKDAATKLKHL
ncbi:protein O-mannosyl-transferase Tmtc3-like isoform X2 [Halichondria panicea]|uniref:protein O-mannosyl-transferase Tmtc3-like isoform X2 n=1 Tax=Halichondria panicea TaxID=6063 RepID=UPI00312B43AD